MEGKRILICDRVLTDRICFKKRKGLGGSEPNCLLRRR